MQANMTEIPLLSTASTHNYYFHSNEIYCNWLNNAKFSICFRCQCFAVCPLCVCACFGFVFFLNSIFSIYLFVNWKLWQNTVKWWELQTARRAKHTHELLFICAPCIDNRHCSVCVRVYKCATREVNLEETTLQHNHVYKQTCLCLFTQRI